eukprot:CAMPEP_0197186364 /NCGR_PEP_ID=MMETSP1423-20130617/13770_1 /TAXON_ID=476441 /ORGANISM="Pseudo-nitzschia heimii, Strain UNC1101" /LENGTH=436 /DNA_ID=CAMNT_0042637653 /DNA_START=512 /DNA_END=1822 /DNA_ORIENTATION=+
MAKAHEEKLRAVNDVTQKRDEQIKTLKSEITTLKATVPKESAVVLSSRPTSGMDLSSMTTDELRTKLVQYQAFMAKYIVQAQQQKLRAVQAAELAVALKYEAKIKLLLAGSPDTKSEKEKTETASSSSSTENKLHEARNAHVAAAAKAGKSRWGDKEVAKVNTTKKSEAKEDVKAKPDPKPKAVAEVKITKDPDGNVESNVGASRVNGATKANGVATTAPSPIPLPGSPLFDERNKKVAAAGKAGKSRWGDAEVQKAAVEASKPSLSSTPATSPSQATDPAPNIVVSPEIEAADHGLRKDGGVGGPSLAERVNLGQQLFTADDVIATKAAAPIVEVKPPSVYELRNARIARAAAAGKSRWGNMENAKATTLTFTSTSKSLSSSEAAAASTVDKKPDIVSTPEIEAADHGLRNDGGVGGPSLAERVNLGSGLLKDLE